jgi:hypothetical protein
LCHFRAAEVRGGMLGGRAGPVGSGAAGARGGSGHGRFRRTWRFGARGGSGARGGPDARDGLLRVRFLTDLPVKQPNGGLGKLVWAAKRLVAGERPKRRKPALVWDVPHPF